MPLFPNVSYNVTMSLLSLIERVTMAGKKRINYDALIGEKFGKWTIEGYYSSPKYECIMLECVCECGERSNIQSASLRRGKSKSCKYCAPIKHGLAKKYPAEYRSWCSARNRCNNFSNKNYPNYGGRGIKFSKAWTHFKDFLKDMGMRPPDNYSLDRIDNNGHYEPGNCRWATASEQNSNQRRRKRKPYNTNTPTYKAWSAARTRCYAINSLNYKCGGARGIKMDPKWDDFLVFLNDMGEKPKGLLLSRIDLDGDYTSSNCRWDTRSNINKNVYKRRRA